MNDFFEHIDDYVKGKLSETDHEQFEKAMKENETLKTAVANHDIASEVLDLLVEEDIRSQITALKDEVQPAKVIPYGFRKYLLLAASFILLAAAAYLINQNRQPLHQKLYGEYFSEFIDPTTRGETDIDGLSICDKGHYLMTNDDNATAREIFENHTSQDEDQCTDKSQWYLMLLYLQKDEVSKRDELLDQIRNDASSIYQQRAYELYNKIH